MNTEDVAFKYLALFTLILNHSCNPTLNQPKGRGVGEAPTEYRSHYRMLFSATDAHLRHNDKGACSAVGLTFLK
jgi:hypothetical protein